MEIEPRALSGGECYNLLVSTVVPRPIAFISSQDETGQVNLAPFSYFNLVTTQPALVSISIGQRKWQGQRVKKDTLRNIERSGEFVINIASVSLIDALNRTAAELPPGHSELEAVGLTASPSRVVGPPRVAECPVHLECKLERVIMLGEHPQTGLVIGEVVHYHASDDVWDAAHHCVDPKRLDPLARLGGTFYAGLGALHSLPRPGR